MHTISSDRTSTPRDRREHDRQPLDVLLNRFVNGQPYVCRATDISRTGMRIETIHEPTGRAAPRFMGLQFQLPGSNEVLTASGEAVFRDDDGQAVGVRFTTLPPTSAAVLERFLSEARR